MGMVHRIVWPGLVVGLLGLGCNGGVGDPTSSTTSAPTITGVSTPQSLVNNSVDIYGTYFTGATALTFNGVPVTSFTVISATDIAAVVPTAASTGKITVTTPGGTATSAGTFAITPAITSMSPASGAVGTSVTLLGSGFSGTTRVVFGVQPATATSAVYTVNSANQLTVLVPAGAATGNLYLTSSDITCEGPVFTVQ